MITPLSPSPVTELPPDLDFIASKTDEEKIEYIKSVLARSEDDAIAVIAPALRFYGTAGAVVEAYLPLILEVKKHVCRPGRPRVDPATGERNKTWEEICKENFHITIRRMQQILASLKEPKLPGRGGTTRRPSIDRKEYERAKQVAAPARSLAEAVVKQGMGDRFPDALEILKLADIPVPKVQPVAITAGVNTETDWKNILTELVTTLEQYGDRLPVPVIQALKSTQELLDGKAGPQAALKLVMDITGQNRNAQSAQFPPTKPIADTPQDASPLDVANQDAPPQAATGPAPKRGRRGKTRKPISPLKVTVSPPTPSPEEEERIHERLSESPNYPGRRQGDSVINEEGKWEFDPEEQRLPPAKLTATDPKPFRVKTRVQGDIIDFAVIRDGDKLPYEVFDTECEAKAFCERLNTPPILGIVPQRVNPQSAAQSAA